MLSSGPRHSLQALSFLAVGSLAIAGCSPTNSTSSHPVRATETAAQTRWVDAWGTSYLSTLVMGNIQSTPTLNNQTLRQNMFSHLAGTTVHVRLSNRFSTTPVVIGAAHIAQRKSTPDQQPTSEIVPETDKVLTFNGARELTLLPDQEIWSDPVPMAVKQHQDLAVSIFLPQSIHPTSFHPTGLKTQYVTSGDHTGDATFQAAGAGGAGGRGGRGGPGGGGGGNTMYLFVSDIQVIAPAKTKVIVTLGDSITDGATAANNANAPWPEILSKRLPALKDGTPVSVINMGIGSNRFTSADTAGPAGLKRLQHDVLDRTNVTHLIIMEGINDISYEQITPEKLTAAYSEAIDKAHAKGIKVFGATLLPIQNSRKDTPYNIATQQAVNKWIRESKKFDAVLDFEKVLQDPNNPLRIRADLQSDYVHPNTQGYRLMGESIDLSLFE